MHTTEYRQCNKCGCPVTYVEAEDDPFAGVAKFFVQGDHCPKCKQSLSLETTSKWQPKKRKSSGKKQKAVKA